VNREQAREILLLYRPGTADAEDPQVVEAMEVARQDPELARWFQQHRAFQQVLRLKFRQIDPPEHLKTALLSQQNIVQPAFWRPKPSTVWWAAAAAIFLIIGTANLLLKPVVPDRFANFRERMVSTALREYRMDVVTNNMRVLRQTLDAKGAPADYQLSHGLQNLQLTGGAALIWRSHPVSMVCLDRGNKSMVFLFVVKRTAVKDPPPNEPKLFAVNNLPTSSWSQGDNSYLLVGSVEPDLMKR